MTRIRRITVSQVEGGNADTNDINEIRPFGETAFYLDDNDKLTLVMFDGVRTHIKSKVLSPGVLYGSNADSGDGTGLDTIKLIPDASLHFNGSQQYLIVDPTGPDHIHLRAGGTIDDSNSVLYVGGETSHFRVDAGLNPPVYISSNNKTWGFDGSGTLTFPSGDSYQAGMYFPPLDTDFTINSRSRALAFANAVTGSGQDTYVTDISTNDDIIAVQPGWTVLVGLETYTVSSVVSVPGSTCTITVPGALFVEGEQYIFRSNNITNSLWNFGTTGVLTTPGLGTITHQNNDLKLEVSGTDVIVLRTAGGDTVMNADGSLTVADITFSTGTITVPPDNSLNFNLSFQSGPETFTTTTFSIAPESIALPTGNGTIFSGTGEWALDTANKAFRFPHNDQIIYDTNSVGLEVFTYTNPVKITSGQTKSWTFGTDGNLTAPGDVNVPVGYGFKTTDAFQLTAGVRGQTVDVYETLALCNNRFYLYTNWGQVGTGGQKAWAFNEDGSITFPDASSQTTAYTGAYTPATPADWNGTPPTTIAEAIDRLAARIKLIDGGTGA